MKNRLADKRHRALEKLLLSNPKEVKRLTELIILEQEVNKVLAMIQIIFHIYIHVYVLKKICKF